MRPYSFFCAFSTLLAACGGSAVRDTGEVRDASAQSAISPDLGAPEHGASDAGAAIDASSTGVAHLPSVMLASEFDTTLACENVELAFDFDPTPGGFSVDQAFWMMWFAERSFYSDAPETARELASIGFDRFLSIKNLVTGLQLYVAGGKAAVIVAFRGSDAANDWLGDFNFGQDDGGKHGLVGRVHRGFARALNPSYQAIADSVRAFSAAGQTVWVTGHSLGGAEATLAAVRLARGGASLGPLYDFAAPRAGDSVFADYAFQVLGRRVFRIVNERDLVPRLPPPALAAVESASVLPLLNAGGAQWVRDLDYRHVGSMVWLEREDGADLTILPAMSDAQDRPYWEELGQDGTLGAIADNQQQGARHAPERYLCRLLAARTALSRSRAALQ